MSQFKIIISENADSEFIESFKFYEQKRKGLGEEFEVEIEKVLNAIERNPLLFARKYKSYREAKINKFPFFIVYEIVRQHVVVYSFFHTSRSPKKKYKRK